MKRRLIRPPENNGEILFLPQQRGFLSQLTKENRLGTAHQPYFFNPGISIKFIFLEYQPLIKKRIIFIDTDRLNLRIKMPSNGKIEIINLITVQDILRDYPTPKKIFKNFFSVLENKLNIKFDNSHCEINRNLLIFKEIFFKNLKRKFLKEVLACAFIEFYDIKTDYAFLSDEIRDEAFYEFFLKIYKDDVYFRKIFNQALDDYKKEFRFRYKNFPFPKLCEGELPFWIIQSGKRLRCFKKDVDINSFRKQDILPRAVTLTLFLRLYKFDYFIHGIGGANYEWIQDRVIERFFKKAAPLFMAISGTFLIENFKERELPYFFFSPQAIKKEVENFIRSS